MCTPFVRYCHKNLETPKRRKHEESDLERKAYVRKEYACGHLADYFKDRPLSTIDGDDIEHYRVFRRKVGTKDSTIDYELRILKNMYNLAIKRRKIPFEFKPQEFTMAKETNPRRMVSLEEFHSLLKHSDYDFKDLLTCAWCTGMRISEMLGLTAGQYT